MEIYLTDDGIHFEPYHAEDGADAVHFPVYPDMTCEPITDFNANIPVMPVPIPTRDYYRVGRHKLDGRPVFKRKWDSQ